MGFGDELMALGHAQRAARETGGRVRILDRKGLARWHPLWAREPRILRPGEAPGDSAVSEIVNGPGARPYIFRWDVEDGRPRAVFSRWEAESYRATCRLTEEEAERAQDLARRFGPYAVLEHRTGPQSSPNKTWSSRGYAEVMEGLRGLGLRVVQVGPEPAGLLRGAVHVPTADFADVFPVLAGAELYVGPEGGLHHAAAAVGARAVVLFGHFIGRRVTGYADHAVVGGEHGCGRWAPCLECRRWMDTLPAERVLSRVAQVIQVPRREVPAWER